ncbi:MAG: hypothetical protein WAV41_01250 [Microgenomates group bacterium]
MFTPQKSKTLLFLLILVWFPLSWFIIQLPISQFNSVLQNAPKYINENLLIKYPTDLIITLKSGQVSLNQPSPYCLVLDDKSNSGVVFDTALTGAPNPADLGANGKYSQLCTPMGIIGRQFVLYPDKENSYKVTQISPDLNYTIDKPAITKFVDQYLPNLLSFAKSGYYFGPIILALFAYLYFLLINTWYTLVTRFFTRVLKISTSYPVDQIFNLTLFFYTFVLAFDWIIIGYFVHTLAGLTNVSAIFFLRNTIVITLLSLYYQTSRPPIVPSQSPLDSGPSPLPPAV